MMMILMIMIIYVMMISVMMPIKEILKDRKNNCNKKELKNADPESEWLHRGPCSREPNSRGGHCEMKVAQEGTQCCNPKGNR